MWRPVLPPAVVVARTPAVPVSIGPPAGTPVHAAGMTGSTSAQLREVLQEKYGLLGELKHLRDDMRIQARVIVEKNAELDGLRAQLKAVGDAYRQEMATNAAHADDLTRLTEEAEDLRPLIASRDEQLRAAAEEIERVRQWRVASADSVSPCTGCGGRIERHHAVRPTPGADGRFKHVLCGPQPAKDSPPNPGAGPRKDPS